MKRFEDKVVIVTGASGALDRAASIRLASEGAKLTLVGTNEEKLKETERLVKEENKDAETLIVTANVTKEEDVKKYVDETVKKWNRIDGLLNNSGVEGKQNLTQDYGSEEFLRVLDVNLIRAFYGMKHVLEVMKKQGSGHIANTASVGGIRGVGNQSGYAASKHGVVGLTRNSAVEYGEFGITINAIAPGAIMTDMVEHSLKQMDPDNWEEAGKEFVSVNPSKRFGKVEEFAAVAAFLLSDDANFVNGIVLPIDGGQSYKY